MRTAVGRRQRVQRRPRRRRGLAAATALAVAMAVAVTVAPAADAATGFDPHLTRAPYLTDLVGLHVNVNWATDQSAATGTLQWGPVTNGVCSLPNTATATRSTIKIVFSTATVYEYQWKVGLALPTQGTYCYRPWLSGTDLLAANPAPQFVTQAPAGDTAPFSFDVLGDWGSVDSQGNNADQANLYARIAASGARFAVTVGDNGYPSGSQANYGDLQHSGSGTSAIFGPSFWTVAGGSIPLFTAVGNHGLSGTAHTDISTWTQDVAVATSGGTYANGTYSCCSGGTVNYANEWYAFDAGPARFYVLDSAWGDTNGGTSTPYGQDAANHFSPTAAEYQWLVNDLQTHPGQLKFAFSHYPWYSNNSSQTSDTYLQGATGLEGLLGRYGVKIAFNGHAHIYQRNVASAPGMPITYVTGGGGATLEPIGPCTGIDAYGIGWSPTKLKGYSCGAARPPTSAGQVFHFLKVTVAGSSVTVAPTDENGTTFDVQTYDFSGDVDTVIDSAPAALVGVTTASFSFHATVGGATYACSLDGAPAGPCTSPTAYSGLAEGAHTFAVAASENGNTDPSPATDSWTVDTTAPTTPTNLAGSATAPTSVALTWSPSTDATGVTGYDVIRDGTPVGAVSGSTTSYVDATVSPTSTYSYTVTARDGAGNVSTESAPATVTTPAGSVAPSLVQAAGSPSTTVTLAQTSTSGDLLVLSASVYTGATNNITSVTDMAGNTWTRISASSVSGHNSDGELWYAANARPTTAITVHLGTLVSTALVVQEFAGVAATSPVDVTAGTANTGTVAGSGPLTPTGSNELLVGFVAGHGNSEAMTVTSSGFVTQPQQTTGASVASVVAGYQVLGPSSTQSFGATFPAAMYWAAGLVAFKPAP